MVFVGNDSNNVINIFNLPHPIVDLIDEGKVICDDFPINPMILDAMHLNNEKREEYREVEK